ncbi:MAG: sulfite exporter TauE/SafE family protein, partial [Phycisphaerae bacterium]|nr:sulfite exporter TauE/SafE family protein [Phycisphaerae bacterium]
GLLGVGGGIIKVPVMTLVMNVPIKAATATSNFMIGVTAAASAGVYFLRGDVDPFIAAPVVLGITAGATLGSRLLGKMRSAWLRYLFVIILLIVCVQMLIKKG